MYSNFFMSTSLKIGKKYISPKRAKDKKGTQGIFLTEREWNAVLEELKIKTTLKKESTLASSLLAIEEVEQYFQGKKNLRNAKVAVGEL